MTTIVHEQRKWMDLVPGTSATSAFDENSGRQVTLQCQNWPVGNFAFGIFGRPLQTYKVSSCEREHTWEIDSERYRGKDTPILHASKGWQTAVPDVCNEAEGAREGICRQDW